jgi:hypothetical protein
LPNRFIQDGWSVKKLVRTLVLTRAYQLGSESTAAHQASDPANRLVWRHTPRRLDAEEMRDAMLASAGTLNPQRPAGSPAMKLKMVEIRDNGPEARAVREQADRSTFRSVYLPLVRGITPHTLEAFDPVEQTLVTGRRDTTTVPGQALYLLNSSFVRRQALTLGERLLADKGAADADRVRTAYRLTLGRSPTEEEVQRARTYLAEYEAVAREALTFTPPKPKVVPAEQPKTPKPPPANPDEIDQTGEPVVEDVLRPKDAQSAAWLSFVQALFGSAEFRYLK